MFNRFTDYNTSVCQIIFQRIGERCGISFELIHYKVYKCNLYEKFKIKMFESMGQEF